MQWFTEFMELFLSVWELIKTLNICFVCFSKHKPGPWGSYQPICRALGCDHLCLPSIGSQTPTQSWVPPQLLCRLGSGCLVAQALQAGSFWDAVLAEQTF
uniref:Uncharacterized protein n=1 Tax=Colobus angolensis palliatus TaxID=336983 RepID=A0A2K5HSB3_COLAP